MRSLLGTDSVFRDRLRGVVQELASYQRELALSGEQEEEIRRRIQSFGHVSRPRRDFLVGGVDGSGDFPCVQFADSFVYVTTAASVAYRTDPIDGLCEVDIGLESVGEPVWLPAQQGLKDERLDEAFERIVGRSIEDTISASDYRTLKHELTGEGADPRELREGLIRPPGHDAANLGVQLRSTAELAGALKLIEAESKPDYVLVDTTLSLPLVTRKRASLFFEHVKRLCCVVARRRGVAFVAISKSHGMPRIDLIEDLARDVAGLRRPQEAEHWYLRLWQGFPMTEGRRVPPVGAVSYLVRFHRQVPVLRVDLDEEFWEERIRSDDEEETRDRERSLFEDLDYCCHDQRCYGYPYPIKAGHDRCSLTQDERTMIRKLVKDAAAEAGVPRELFEEPSIETGHE